MAEARTCPQCGAPLPVDAPEGLCPQCLLQLGLPSAEPPVEQQPSTGPYAAFTAPSPEELVRHFPQLQIIELVGQGGMGAVYKARQERLDRTVALKILPPAAGRDPAFAERFTREARALAKLNHPNIVGVYDFGETGEPGPLAAGGKLYYFMMEFVDGANLRHVLRSGNLQPREALQIVPQLCDALQYAHDEGIVHRDIKPENILLDKKGRVKVADFGLAKLLGQAAKPFTLTGSHQVMGTPHYMAPEQMEKPLTVDHRADIYSLGVVFYEILTGELPLGRFAPPSQKVQVDVRLDEVVLRALEKEPARRYQHASDVKTEVESIAQKPTPDAPTMPAPPAVDASVEEAVRRRTHSAAGSLLVAGLLLVLASLGGVAWSGWTLARVLTMPSQSENSTQGGSSINFGGMNMPVRYTVNAPPTPVLCAILVEQLAALAAGVIVLFAAYAMHKRESLRLCRNGSLLACLPLSPVWLVTFPLGIRAALLLRRQEVREAFDRPLADATPGPTPLDTPSEPLWQPPSLRTVGGWSLLLCLLGALITMLPWYRENVFGIEATVTGLDTWHGRICGGAFAIALVLLVVCELRQVRGWLRALILVAAGGTAVALMGWDLWEIHRPAQPTITTSMSGDTQIFGDFVKSLEKSMIDLLSNMRVEPLVGPYAAIVCGAVVLALGLWQLRRGSATSG